MVKKLSVGFESIDFQDGMFFKGMAIIYGDLRKLSKKELEEEGVSLPLTRLIRQFTNLKVTISLGDISPSVEVPRVNKNNVLVQDWMKNHLPNSTGKQMVREAGGIIRGGVDLKKGRVTGIFSEVEHTIHMPTELILNEKYTSEELAAITLHEVGHLMTYYEYMTRTVTTNQVLSGVAKELSGTKDEKQIEAVIIDAKKALRLTDLDAEKLTKTKDKRIIEAAILTNAIQSAKSELGSDIYDLNSWEALADNYAAKHGAGRSLVTALAKLQSGYHSSYRSTSYFLFLEVVKMVLLISALITSFGVSYLLGPLGGLLAGMFAWPLFTIMFTMDLNDTTYDRPGVRAKRIRDQVVMRLRDKKISKDERERLEDDLKAIDSVTKDINDRRQFLTVVGGFFFKSIRERYNQERTQQELESLVANDLFLIANELKKGN